MRETPRRPSQPCPKNTKELTDDEAGCIAGASGDPEPKKTGAEIPWDRALQAEISRLIREISARQVEQNLGRALRLVQMAQRGQGPLIDYFVDLGLKYPDLADNGPVLEGGCRLKLIDGGARRWSSSCHALRGSRHGGRAGRDG
jgi:hypothetical protein